MADVEKAFLMISVDERDRDVLRFIWVDDITKEDQNIQLYRLTRVTFGVCSSPFLLNATVKYHLEKFMDTDEAVVKQLLESTYVDVVITGANSAEEAFQLYTTSKDIFRHGGFNLRKFKTNSADLQRRINLSEGTPSSSLAADLDLKVLGVSWNPPNDRLLFDLSSLLSAADKLQPTRRNAVRLIGRFYDLIGFLAPVIIKYMILLQKLCQTKVGWDSELPEVLLKEWNSLLTELREATPISIPWRYDSSVQQVCSYSLCGFCDASVVAYAAVVYLIVESEVARKVVFIASKMQVAPLKTQTIPHLKLLSALLLSRLISSIRSSLGLTLDLSLSSEICYTDSQVALYWIRGTKEWKPFVKNRVTEIRQRVPSEYWSHCPGSQNPADLPSRGLSPLELSVNQLWHQGPESLQEGLAPASQEGIPSMPPECIPELTSIQQHNLVAAAGIVAIIDPTKFSSFTRLIRVTNVVLQAVHKFQTLKRREEPKDYTTSHDECQIAELFWIQQAQEGMTDIQRRRKQKYG